MFLQSKTEKVGRKLGIGPVTHDLLYRVPSLNGYLTKAAGVDSTPPELASDTRKFRFAALAPLDSKLLLLETV